MNGYPRLGVNIDHVATIRNARGGEHPDPVRAAEVAAAAGADGITAHLREDRRHIRDADIERLMAEVGLPLNLEMAATPEMLNIALRHCPHACCIVPERREEVTTEGGLDAAGLHNQLKPIVARLGDAGIRVSLFINAERCQLEAAKSLGAPVVELHTGAYCDAAFARETPSETRNLHGLRRPREKGPRSASKFMPATALPSTRWRQSRRCPNLPNSISVTSSSARRYLPALTRASGGCAP
jgi:pyridoxine 5-phosphate synthase